MNRKRIYSLLMLLSMVIIFSACRKVKEDRCNELETKMDDAGNVFSNNPTQATCEDYIDAIHDWYDGCDVPATLRPYYDAILDYDCSIYAK